MQSTPSKFTQVYQAGACALSSVVAFYAYNVFRTWNEGVGFSWKEFTSASTVSLVFLLPLMGLVGGAGLSLAVYSSTVRPLLRWSRGCCYRCAYPRHSLPSRICPECGAEAKVPSVHSGLKRHIRALVLFPLMVILGWVLGSTSGELWILSDEMRFEQEVHEYLESGGTSGYARPRAWPNRLTSLVYVHGQGIHATE